MKSSKLIYLKFLSILVPIFLTVSSFAQAITFSFSPKDGTEFLQNLTITKDKLLDSQVFQKDETKSKAKIRYLKTDYGWEVTATPIETVMIRNGKKVDNPILQIMSTLSIVYKIDKNGQLMDVQGYAPLMEIINSQFPEEIAKKLEPVLNAEVLKQKDIAEWEGRYGGFVGKQIQIGDMWEFESPFTLPNNSVINYRGQINFKELQPCGNKKCVLIKQIYSSSDSSLSSFSNDIAKSILGTENKETPVESRTEDFSSSMEGQVTRLIDPTTMLIFNEELERLINIEIDIPGKGKQPIQVLEKRVYEFVY